jgi:antitoxin MazE
MKAPIRKLGNSHGVIIPKALLAAAGIQDEADMVVEKGVIVLRKPRKGVRAGWAGASRRIADAKQDVMVWPELTGANGWGLDWS